MHKPETESTSLLRCPRCNKLPQNHADPTVGYSYGCCRMALLTKFSMFQDVATDRWNRGVVKYQKKMESAYLASKQSQEEL